MSAYDVSRLAARLGRDLRGEASTSSGDRALYTSDASNYRVVPDIVVLPRDVDDLTAVVTACAEVGAPLTMRGGGTSMAGNAIGSGVVVDTSRHLTAVLDIDPVAQTATVEPGVVLGALVAQTRRHGLTFGADPSSGGRATIGGMVANNACGAHSLAWGTTSANIAALDVLLSDGSTAVWTARCAGGDGAHGVPADRSARERSLVDALSALAERDGLMIGRRFGRFSRQISGYAAQHVLPAGEPDLARLLCGSEGTLAVTRGATLALTPLPAAVALLVLGFADPVASADAVPRLLPHNPLTAESLGADLLAMVPAARRGPAAETLPAGSAWLLVEVAGDDAESAARNAEQIATAVRDSGSPATARVLTDPAQQSALWRCRRDAAGLATRRPDGSEAWGGWEDSAVPPLRLGEYLRRLDDRLARHGLSGTPYGHFGEGCLHLRVDQDFSSAAGVADFRRFVEEAADLAISLGGSVSGEHGDGRARSELLARMYGADGLAAMAAIKGAFDPAGILNPQVIVDPLPLDGALRPARQPRVRTAGAAYLSLESDGGSFARAQRRCVGVGACRQRGGAVMCPSYQVTGDERHSTRGRAHLLWEMLDGGVITDGWRSTEVRDALDLCLSCKGCLADCPVNVDMAAYKAEFTAHHYARRPWARPRSHWSMGWLPVWLRTASHVPRAANRIAASPVSPVLARLAGVAAERRLPEIAPEPLTARLRSRTRSGPAGRVRPRVLLWPDTFTNHLAPQIGLAALDVLDAAGIDVVTPERRVCCGLTWMSTGQLGAARRVLRRSLSAVREQLEEGLPLLVLEPSCAAMLSHDGPELLDADPLARLAADATVSLAGAFQRLAPDWRPPQVGGRALTQVHCHQYAVSSYHAEHALLAAAGVSVEAAPAGCCGLAGNFGFEAEHYALSMAVGERELLPAVRATSPETAIVADGFSCRTQIRDGAGRDAVHLAELLATALRRPAG